MTLNRGQLIDSAITAAERGKSINQFNLPILGAAIVLWIIAIASSFSVTLTTPSINVRYDPPEPIGRWFRFAAFFLSAPSLTVAALVWREVTLLEHVIESIRDGDMEEAESCLKWSLLAPKR